MTAHVKKLLSKLQSAPSPRRAGCSRCDHARSLHVVITKIASAKCAPYSDAVWTPLDYGIKSPRCDSRLHRRLRRVGLHYPLAAICALPSLCLRRRHPRHRRIPSVCFRLILGTKEASTIWRGLSDSQCRLHTTANMERGEGGIGKEKPVY